MFKGNKNKIYIQKINGLYHRSRIKHPGLELGSRHFCFNTLNDLSNYNDNSLEPEYSEYYSRNGLNFKSKKNFIKNFRLNKKMNNSISIN